jgi:hypothetical protein
MDGVEFCDRGARFAGSRVRGVAGSRGREQKDAQIMLPRGPMRKLEDLFRRIEVVALVLGLLIFVIVFLVSRLHG